MAEQGVPVTGRRATGALVALSIAAFSYVTTEILPVGLLTLMADDLGRSRSEIGLLVTGYAVVVVLASLPLTRITQRVPRRLLLGVALGVFVAATAASALARSYELLLAARLATALTQALFWSVVGATATGLFPARVRGRVIARLSIGNALAPVLGVPTGTWLGQQAGWRAAFLVMAAVNLVTWLAVVALVPTFAPEDGGAARGTAPDTRRYGILVLGTTLGVTGAMTAYTYITPFLLDVSRFAAPALGPLLLVSGVAGVAGTVTIGTILDRHPRAAVIAPLAVITGALAGLYLLGAVRPAAVAMLALTGLSFSALAAAVGSRTLQVAPGSTDMAAAGISSAFNVGIAGGSLLGGVLIAAAGVRSVALAGAVLTAAALAAVVAEQWLVRRRGWPSRSRPPPPGEQPGAGR
jgi:DHA1 family L-arabinose/isopropyl-beta-D-thiogalactopyranoside export protein-like MFS transporter/DHA1 family inner membrane transport protein